MKRTPLLIAFALLLASALPASAALKKYKDWSSSPEAYFLTADERKSWDAVASDEDAEKFVQAYRDARGKGFAAAIQSRIEFADRTLGLGKKKGSLTMRGKTLILLGSPTRVSASSAGSAVDSSKADISTLDARSAGGGEKSRGSSNPAPYTNSGGPGDPLRGARVPDVKTVQVWVYGPDTLPVGDKTKDTPIAFTIDQDSGQETVSDPAKLQQLFDAIVAHWGPRR
jgi:GWxTD domain-containing protein